MFLIFKVVVGLWLFSGAVLAGIVLPDLWDGKHPVRSIAVAIGVVASCALFTPVLVVSSWITRGGIWRYLAPCLLALALCSGRTHDL